MPRVSSEYLAARRRHILAAAARRFVRDGFHQTSIQDVIDEAGLSPGGVYRYFRSKDDIIVAISLEAIGAVQEVVQDAVRTHRPLAELVAALPQAIAELDQADDRMRLAVQAWGEALRNPTLGEAMREGAATVVAVLRERILVGQQDGDVAAQVDPDAAAHALLSLIQGFILQRAWNPELSADVYGCGAGAVVAGMLAA
ncbi:TetR/AcrR family transcriptional regulator [Myceligenerans indicum]|uniref:TetR/AcrR family transcriptional regulator n=1 Tax=Myceligenerans indicum TaxID=2593663 RepID=A0ABS1LHX7_9MICO|nr:TetR/AcrR family transcriptional regulator [Myceligenerans indicum]MBL0885182.1 TetR/AcrR family transcriptional regulator [Myceligenerans indicum]